MRKKNSEKIPAVIYARYSSSRQREESIEGQIRECMDYAERNNYKVISKYIDRAQSGRTDKRTNFQRMIDDAPKGQFAAIIVWKIDRFARNRYDAAVYKYKLKKYDVSVVSAVEHIPDGPEGIILESVMEGYAEYYSANLAQNVKRGMYESALECKALGNKIYGYDIDEEGKYVVNKIEANTVKKIFEKYASGVRTSEIVEWLNSNGFRNKRGNEFKYNSITKMVANEKYTGVYSYSDEIRIEDGMPAIVDRETYLKCLDRLVCNKRMPARNKKANFYLTTKAYCGKCGALMAGDSGTSKSHKTHHYYTCVNRKRHTCDKKRIRKDVIEGIIIDELVRLVHSDDFIEEVADMVIKYQEESKDTSIAEAYEAEIKEINKKIQNMINAIEAGIITESTRNRLKELEKEKELKERQLAKHLMEQPMDFTKDQIVYALYRFRDKEIDNKNYKTKILETFLQTVYVYDDKIVMTLNYTGANNKITKSLIDEAVSDLRCSDELNYTIEPGCSTEFNHSRPYVLKSEHRQIFIFKMVLGVVIPAGDINALPLKE